MTSDPTAPSTVQNASSTDVEHQLSDDSLSDNSFDSDHRSHNRAYEYLSTNLVAGRNITLADVSAEDATPAIMH